uniref:Uncharacterized protein n=1 Tax=Triticum urartu TaxID=4572 RepID=A0A8R7TIN4_TRIUA
MEESSSNWAMKIFTLSKGANKAIIFLLFSWCQLLVAGGRAGRGYSHFIDDTSCMLLAAQCRVVSSSNN